MQKGMLRPIHYDTEFCLTEQRRQFCQQCESIGTSCGKLGRADSCLDGGKITGQAMHACVCDVCSVCSDSRFPSCARADM